METVWISKYALTRDIYQVSGEQRMFGALFLSNSGTYFHRGDFHATREEATAKGAEMARKKLLALKRQAARVQQFLDDYTEGK